ncbi:bifunctional chorismate mutase/prephenate dehydratase, partial [Salmonella enterica]|nr:bifunctional chorismate mutase/prephenate dehydratase [Salmonella enterica]
EDIKSVHSHIHALGQCRKIIRGNGWKPVIAGDTAGAARQVADLGDKSKAALAPLLAAELYGLEILQHNVEDAENNITRF